MKTSISSPGSAQGNSVISNSENASPLLTPPASPKIPFSLAKSSVGSNSAGSGSWKKILRANSPSMPLASSASSPSERGVILGIKRSVQTTGSPTIKATQQTTTPWQPTQRSTPQGREQLSIIVGSQVRALSFNDTKATTYINHKDLLVSPDTDKEMNPRARESRDIYVLVEFTKIGETSSLEKVIAIEENSAIPVAIDRILRVFEQEEVKVKSEMSSIPFLVGDYALFTYEKTGNSGRAMRLLKSEVSSGISRAVLACLARQQTVSVRLLDGTINDVNFDITNTVRNAINRISAMTLTGELLMCDDVDLALCVKDGTDPVLLSKDNILFIEMATHIFENKIDITLDDFWWFKFQLKLVPVQKSKNLLSAICNEDMWTVEDDSINSLCLESSPSYDMVMEEENITSNISCACAQKLRLKLDSFIDPHWKPQGIQPHTKIFKDAKLQNLCNEFISAAESLVAGASPNTEALCAMVDEFYSLYFVALEMGVCEASVPNYCFLVPAYKHIWISAQKEFIHTLETPSKRNAERTIVSFNAIKALISQSVSILDPNTFCFSILPRERQRLLASLCNKLRVILAAISNILTDYSKHDLSKYATEFGEDITFHVTLLAPFLMIPVAANELKSSLLAFRGLIVKNFCSKSNSEWSKVINALCIKAVNAIDDILIVFEMKQKPNLDNECWEVIDVVRCVLCSLGHFKMNPSKKAFKHFYKHIYTLFSVLAEVIDSSDEVTIKRDPKDPSKIEPQDDETREILSNIQDCVGRLLLHVYWLEKSVLENKYTGSVFTLSVTVIPFLLRNLVLACPGLGPLTTYYDNAILNTPCVDILADTVNAEAKTLEFILGTEIEDDALFNRLLKEEKDISKLVTETLLSLSKDEPIHKVFDHVGVPCLRYACTLSMCLAPFCLASVSASLKRSTADALLTLSMIAAQTPCLTVYPAVASLLSGLEAEMIQGFIRRDDSSILQSFLYTKTSKKEMSSKRKKEDIIMKTEMIANELRKLLRVVCPAVRNVCTNISVMGETAQERSRVAELANSSLAVIKNVILSGIRKACALLLSCGHDKRIRKLENFCTKLLRAVYCAAEAIGLGYIKLRLSAYKDLDSCAQSLTRALAKAASSSKASVPSKKMRRKEDLELVGYITRLKMSVKYFSGVKLPPNSRMSYIMDEIITIANVAVVLISGVYREQHRQKEKKHKKHSSTFVNKKILELSRSISGATVFIGGTFYDFVRTGNRTLQELYPACTLLRQYAAEINAAIKESSKGSETFVCGIVSAAAALDVSIKALDILLKELRPPDSLDAEDVSFTPEDVIKELEEAKSSLEKLQRERFK